MMADGIFYVICVEGLGISRFLVWTEMLVKRWLVDELLMIITVICVVVTAVETSVIVTA